MAKKGIRVDRFTWQPGDLVPVDEIKGIKPPDEEEVEERAVDFFNQDGRVYVYDEDADFVAERTVRMTRPAGANVQRVILEVRPGPEGGPLAEGTYKLTFVRGNTVEFIIDGIGETDGRYQLSRIDDAWILRRPIQQNTTYPEEHDIDAAITEAKRLGHDKLLWRETPGSDLRTIDV